MGAREAEEPARGRGRRRRPLGARELLVGAAPRGAAEGATCTARLHAAWRAIAEPANGAAEGAALWARAEDWSPPEGAAEGAAHWARASGG